MSTERVAAGLEDVISSFSLQVLRTQQKLDSEHLHARDAFVAFYAAAAAANLGEYARQFSPQHMIVQDQQIEFSFITGASSLSEIRVMNRVLQRRYRARTVAHKIQLEIRRSPVTLQPKP